MQGPLYWLFSCGIESTAMDGPWCTIWGMQQEPDIHTYIYIHIYLFTYTHIHAYIRKYIYTEPSMVVLVGSFSPSFARRVSSRAGLRRYNGFGAVEQWSNGTMGGGGVDYRARGRTQLVAPLYTYITMHACKSPSHPPSPPCSLLLPVCWRCRPVRSPAACGGEGRRPWSGLATNPQSRGSFLITHNS